MSSPSRPRTAWHHSAFDDLQAQYIEVLTEPIRELTEALSGRAIDREESDAEILRVAHQLKGSGASFGFPEISAAAAAVLDAEPEMLEDAARELIASVTRLAEGPDPSASHLLIIDDDPAIRLLLDAALDGSFDEIEALGSVAEARASLERSRPDLILLDLVLPDGDGREFLRELRDRPGQEQVRIAVMSAHSHDDVRAECLRLGADGYIQKPFRPDRVAAQIDEVLSTSPVASKDPTGETATDPDSTSKPLRASGARVLIADDDPLTAALVADRLERRGYSVHQCADGQEALKAAGRRDLDLIIVDVNMPKMNGFQLLTRLREMRRHAETPVLVLTGMGDESGVVRAFELGANDYMLKPFSPTELAARAARLVAS